MKKVTGDTRCHLGACALLSLLAAPGLGADNSAATAPELAFAVRVYNHAEVHRKTLTRAKREATKIFRKIGVETRWVDCPLTVVEVGLYPECKQFERGGPAVLGLHLRSRRMAKAFGFNAKTFGVALLTRGKGFPIWANVFVHRVEELAYLRTPGKATILGHVMAHEVGHLFLGPGSHSSSGLMGFPWAKGRLQKAAEGALTFTKPQGEEIRNQVERRMNITPRLRQSLVYSAL